MVGTPTDIKQQLQRSHPLPLQLLLLRPTLAPAYRAMILPHWHSHCLR
jgi:hypothetical protein